MKKSKITAGKVFDLDGGEQMFNIFADGKLIGCAYANEYTSGWHINLMGLDGVITTDSYKKDYILAQVRHALAK